MKANYFMIVQDKKTQLITEEPIVGLIVTRDSPHFITHGIGYYPLLEPRSTSEASYYGQRILEDYNEKRAPEQNEKVFVSVKDQVKIDEK
ncbi:hypothetical protein [Carnobacterium maltaromaticum]|uniref:hypothetical protein n=1 Tax=Carnobacterium maltaromaticum TaxID=2751 RepID=UPI0012F9DF12|nr:hypothetical protein [Carnobacterium maltaromaticum]